MKKIRIGGYVFGLAISSAQPVWAAGAAFSFQDLAYGLFNFAIFMVIVIWAIRKVVLPKLRERRDSIVERMNHSRNVLTQVNEKLSLIKSQQANLEQEVAHFQTALLSETEKEAAQIVYQAEQYAESLLANARKMIEYEKDKAIGEIQNSIVSGLIDEVRDEMASDMNGSRRETWTKKLLVRSGVEGNGDPEPTRAMMEG